MTKETMKERAGLLEELMKQKISEANSLKESVRPVDAFNMATKEISKKLEDIINPKKQEALEMLSKAKISGEFYKFLIEILDQLAGVLRHSKLDSEKLLSVKQHELNFIAQEYNKIKEMHNKLVSEMNKQDSAEKQEEQKAYVRPDQNPNTKIGKAAIDLQQRRKAAKVSDEES